MRYLVLTGLFATTWLAAHSFAQCGVEAGVESFGMGSAGTNGVPELRNAGAPEIGTPYHVEVARGLPQAAGILLASTIETQVFLAPFVATSYLATPFYLELFALDADGTSPPLFDIPDVHPSACGLVLILQAAVFDGGATGGAALTQALRVRAGKTDGPLFPSPAYLVGSDPRRIVTGDFDRDGTIDVASCSSFDDDVSVLFGRGDGTFEVSVSVPAGDRPFYLVTEDLDGDGNLDFATANQRGDDVTVMLNAGDGTFGPPASYPTAGVEPRALAVGDLDDDGALDLATADTGGGVSLFRGLGGGVFADAVSLPAGTAPAGLGLEDLDGDHALDIVVTNELSDDLSVFLGSGDGTFTALAPARDSFDVYTLRGLGVGVFEDAAGHTRANATVDLETADLNGDGVSDMAAVLPTFDQVAVFLGAGDGTFAVPPTYPAGNMPAALAIADMDGDDVLDLLIADELGGDVSILPGLGDGTFGTLQAFPTAEFARPNDVERGDFNADGIADFVVVTRVSGETYVFLGLGGGAFAAPAIYPVANGSTVAVGDVNEDGVEDLVVTAEVFLGVGDGTFTPAIPVSISGSVHAVEIADVDDDGTVDLVYGAYNAGLLYVLRGNGDGTFGPDEVFTRQASSPNHPQSIAVGDLNGDGLLDVAAPGSSRVSVLFNQLLD